MPRWTTIDAGAKRVEMDVVTGFNPKKNTWEFSGYYAGWTVVGPVGWRVEIAFTNRDGDVPHSLVVTDLGPGKFAAAGGLRAPAFPRHTRRVRAGNLGQ